MPLSYDEKVRATQDCRDCRHFAWDKSFMQPTMQKEGFFQNIITWHHPSCPKVKR